MHSTDNDHATSEVILEAASAVFAAKGFDGARVDELARAAGVNKATLYYQVGDKEALYHAVLERVFRRTADEIAETVTTSDAPIEQLRRLIAVFAQATGTMCYASPILLREIASGGSNLPDDAVAQMGRILGTLDTILTAGEAQGLFRPVNGFLVHMMIVGSLMLYAANEPIRRRNAERNPDIYNPQHFVTHEEAGTQIADLILAAIRSHPN